MSENIATVILALLAYSMGAFILGGTVYLIVAHQWSMWWMLLAVMCIPAVSIKTKRSE